MFGIKFKRLVEIVYASFIFAEFGEDVATWNPRVQFVITQFQGFPIAYFGFFKEIQLIIDARIALPKLWIFGIYGQCFFDVVKRFVILFVSKEKIRNRKPSFVQKGVFFNTF